MVDPKSGTIVLVTGAGGYIGSHACLALLEAGYTVVALDNMVNCWKDERLSQPESLIRVQILAGRQLRFYQAELLCKTSLEQIFKEIIQEFGKIDVCMHFAALKAVGESCSKPLQYYKNNISGTINLIETLAKFGCKSLIYSSSATVYGDPATLPIRENDPTGINLTNPYGKTKYMTEEILKDLSNAEPDWGVVSLRYFNPVGAHSSGLIGEDPNGIPNNLVPFVAQVAAGKLPSLKVFGGDYPTKDGTGVRDYIHITDLIDGHVKALEFILKEFKGFKTYNLGTGKGYSVLEVIRAFKAASRREIPYEIVGRRPGDIAASYCDASLAQQELGWVATRDIDDMCKLYFNKICNEYNIITFLIELRGCRAPGLKLPCYLLSESSTKPLA
ncbi:unnamed protein product [Nesidiocoris tenuis]|uniref:UDP-glucose 4-epimerase n=1 Tax=Nesidiocoris tenuis TaxID=355587 RepID=A0A6H5GZI6_9HEMI|nr:unnamed protein product [Nesidiocoris tenuis]